MLKKTAAAACALLCSIGATACTVDDDTGDLTLTLMCSNHQDGSNAFPCMDSDYVSSAKIQIYDRAGVPLYSDYIVQNKADGSVISFLDLDADTYSYAFYVYDNHGDLVYENNGLSPSGYAYSLEVLSGLDNRYDVTAVPVVQTYTLTLNLIKSGGPSESNVQAYGYVYDLDNHNTKVCDLGPVDVPGFFGSNPVSLSCKVPEGSYSYEVYAKSPSGYLWSNDGIDPLTSTYYPLEVVGGISNRFDVTVTYQGGNH